MNINEEVTLKDADTAAVIAELYNRGVELRDIFGRYYEFDEMGSHGGSVLLTVEDAQLVYGAGDYGK